MGLPRLSMASGGVQSLRQQELHSFWVLGKCSPLPRLPLAAPPSWGIKLDRDWVPAALSDLLLPGSGSGMGLHLHLLQLLGLSLFLGSLQGEPPQGTWEVHGYWVSVSRPSGRLWVEAA